MVIKMLAGSLIVKEVAFTAAEVATIVAVEQDIPVPGVTTDCVLLAAEHPPTGGAVGVGGARIKSDGVVAVTYINPTVGALTPDPGTWKFVFTKYK